MANDMKYAEQRRLIDADKLQETVQEAMKEYDGYSPYDRLALSGLIVAGDLIDDAPTVEEAVIPVCCKDCKHWMYECGDLGLCVADVPDIDGVQRYANDFCSYAVRGLIATSSMQQRICSRR